MGAAAAAACAAGLAPLGGGAQAADQPLSVVATTGMIADAVARIGGAQVSVSALMGPGVDPHGYRQTRSDIVAMAKADLVLWNGLYLEAQMEDLFAELAQKKTVVALADQLAANPAIAERLIAHDDYADQRDPHVWMDPDLWSLVVDAAAEALIAAAPSAAAAEIAANTAAYKVEIAAAGAYAREVLASVPAESRVLLTAHDAFNYFGAAYGYEVVGVQGISTESEAGLNRVAELVDLLVSRQVKAVFVESSVSDRNIRALTEGAAAKGHSVAIGGSLYSDAMGLPGTYEGTYLGMIDHNATTIARALGGTAPVAGRLGQLAAG